MLKKFNNSELHKCDEIYVVKRRNKGIDDMKINYKVDGRSGKQKKKKKEFYHTYFQSPEVKDTQKRPSLICPFYYSHSC